jgi:hypothetical protein
MNEQWAMLVIGVLLIAGGITASHVRGPMPGSTLRLPVPFRMRVILISFGALMCILGLVRLLGR